MSATTKLITAARQVVADAFDKVRTINGHSVGIEGDDGEKCWCVPDDVMHALKVSIEDYDKRRRDLKNAKSTGG